MEKQINISTNLTLPEKKNTKKKNITNKEHINSILEKYNLKAPKNKQTQQITTQKTHQITPQKTHQITPQKTQQITQQLAPQKTQQLTPQKTQQ